MRHLEHGLDIFIAPIRFVIDIYGWHCAVWHARNVHSTVCFAARRSEGSKAESASSDCLSGQGSE